MFHDTLPSIIIAYSLNAPLQSTFLTGQTSISIRCTVDVNVALDSLQLVWIFFDVVNSTTLEFGSGGGGLLPVEDLTRSLDLTLDVVGVLDAGEYTCWSVLIDTMGHEEIVHVNHTIFVESNHLITLIIACILKYTLAT